MPANSPSETAAKLEELKKLNLSQLKQYWLKIYDSPPPAAARHDYLIRGIAYRLQEQARGRRSSSSARRLLQAASHPVRRVITTPTKLRSGSWLLREYRGVTHEVEVTEGGYAYAGAVYRSLSEIARKITGVRWSGPLFFGLRKNGSGSLSEGAGPRFVVDLTAPAQTSGRKPQVPSETEVTHAV